MKLIEKDVVIIGAGLTGLSIAYYLKKAGKRVLIIECNDRVGGVINSVTENGFTYELGPSTGVLSTTEIVELFAELNGKCSLVTANKQKAGKRYIWKNKQWEALPTGLWAAIKTPLFSLSDKFRILAEPIRPKGGYPDESIAELVVRRLGKSYLDYAVDPFISGVYAGDPHQLITRFALPKLYALENEFGGFIRGTIAKHKGVKMKNHKNAHKVTREVFSVEGGLKNFTASLAAEIGSENIILNNKELNVESDKNGYHVSCSNGISIHSSVLVSTVGAYDLPALFPFISRNLMCNIENTTYAPVIHVTVGYNQWKGVRLDGFGGLIPSKEKPKVLGVLFPSAIFAERTPKGGALLSVFLGGINHRNYMELSDSEIEIMVKNELELTMHAVGEPDLVRIHRYTHAIAQYDIKSELRLKSIKAIEEQFHGLILAGSIRDGIGMADRVKQAKTIVDQLLNNSNLFVN